MAAIGLIGPSWGPALVPARAEFHLSLLAAGTLLLLFGGLRAAGSAAAGLLSDRLPRGWLPAGAGAVLAASLATVAMAPDWGVVLAGAGGIGLVFGILTTEVNALAATVPETRARDLNLVNAAYGLGATLGPLALGLLLGAGLGWRPAFWAWAAVSIAPMAGLAAVAARAGSAPPQIRRGALRARVDRAGPGLGVLAAMAFLYQGAGWTVAAWAPTWLVERFGAGLVTASVGSTAFYGFLTLGRLADAALLARMPAGRVLWLQCATAAVALGGLLAAPRAGVALAAFALAGFALGGVYPNLVARAAAMAPDRPGAMSGVIATTGAVGVSLVPFGAGALGRAAGAGAIGWCLPALGLALAALAWSQREPAGRPASAGR
jgi:fucose permease